MLSTKIVRTPTRAKGGITDEEKEQMRIITDKWIKNAFQTGEIDKEKLKDAIKGLYRVAKLKEPRVVIVPSPLIMALSYGLSAGWWEANNNKSSKKDVDIATRKAIAEATDRATYEATDEATREAAYEASMEVTDEATRDATIATKYATRAATDRAKINKKWLYNLALVFSDGDKNTAIRMLDLCKKWTQVYQGGNMWSAYQAYADAMQNVIKLTGLKCWENFEPYRQASIYGGFRVMHEKFCIVSEFPEILKVNANNRPHCETGPSHRWKDGFEIYHLNGIRVPKWLVMTDAGKIDPKLALTEKNVDVQREIIRKVGAERILKATNAKCLNIFVDRHKNGGNVYKLMKMKLGNSINRKYLYYEHASLPGVWYAQPVPPETKKALHARAWMLRIAELKELEKTPDNKIKKCLPMEVS